MRLGKHCYLKLAMNFANMQKNGWPPNLQTWVSAWISFPTLSRSESPPCIGGKNGGNFLHGHSKKKRTSEQTSIWVGVWNFCGATNLRVNIGKCCWHKGQMGYKRTWLGLTIGITKSTKKFANPAQTPSAWLLWFPYLFAFRFWIRNLKCNIHQSLLLGHWGFCTKYSLQLNLNCHKLEFKDDTKAMTQNQSHSWWNH